ncbi:hypothetical protein [Synechococcus sp. PCC 7336]|uniref:hypothetical protein n=1 Tax=Synechococcus sp. PCC 7336 TaxID=195250 RepID=UPI000366AF74|nr:hypothetical protein [Synechococcus sp. PCC 7336]
MEKTEEFLNQYSLKSQEYYFFRACFDILSKLQIEWGEEDILALIDIFNLKRIELYDGRIIGQDDSTLGTISDICKILAIWFSEISSNPSWWRNQYWSQGTFRKESKRIESQDKIIEYMLTHRIARVVD